MNREVLLELANKLENKPKVREDIITSLIKAGILNANGDISNNYPNLKKYINGRY